jgi:hypothetical protein
MIGQMSLFGDAGYPERPGFKEKGATSQEAAESLPDTKESHTRILALLRTGSFTPDEIASRLGGTVLYWRPRCSELVALGLVEKTAERRPNASGKNAAVHKLK